MQGSLKKKKKSIKKSTGDEVPLILNIKRAH